MWRLFAIPKGPNYRADIDGLRAVAVIGVIAYHAFPTAVPGGFIGVDVFFVISGFLISGIILRDLEAGSFSFVEFYRRRIRRIIPALVLVLAAAWLIGWRILMADEYTTLGRHIAAASVFVSNFVLASEAGYFNRAAEYTPLLHLWSLAVEEQFYLIWPLLLYGMWRLGLRRKIIFICLAALSFGLNIAVVRAEPSWAFYSLPTRLWELAFGALALLMAPAVKGRWIGTAMSAVGLVLVLAGAFLLKGQIGYPGWAALVPTIGTVLLLVAGTDSLINRWVLGLSPAVMVGLISYPLYLWHWPLLSFSRIALFEEPSASFKLAMLALAVVLAFATYRVVEMPIRFRSNRGRVAHAFVPAALVVLLVGFGAIGLLTQRRSGFVSRFPEAVQYLANPTYDDAPLRKPSCLLELNKDESSFGADCAPQSKGPVVFLWGDSHAAHLYPGLRSIQSKEGFSIAQYTAGACPPVLGVDPTKYDVRVPFCREINEFDVRAIERMKPKIVIMAAMWYLLRLDDLDRLKPTIDRLKAAGVGQIILVGPVPVWDPSLPKRLLRYYMTSVPRVVPDWMVGANLNYPRQFDAKLRDIAREEEIRFISAIEAFCRGNECMTNVGPKPSDIVTTDATHFRPAASSYFVSKMLPMLEAGLRSRSADER